MSRNREILSNEKFGKLLVVKEDGRIGRHLVAYLCVCECGNSIRCSSYDLLTRGKVSCGCQKGVSRSEKYVGITFSKLTIISIESLHRDTRKPTQVLCKCECGEEKILPLMKVVGGHISSCGCSKSVYEYKYRKSGFNTVLSRYRDGSIRRGLVFELSDDEAFEITQKDCHYCGISPSNDLIHHGKLTFKYNGIDRYRNELGYTKDNCVPCCAVCNRAKYNMSSEEFYKWIKRIKNYNE